ncbi:multidrug efflux system membrane fusion protein [Silvimonas terrae]|uniref:Multidrug efflux system membrane fusion protein n=1 Tax=Silvimonas terrae TaxID=300266 RepID=A0A840RH94_9NEIS|nr:efflux RND transporter periplasmic adaptor subunit [Silvimonas terrae]MBB5191652.1 multidrug efflux system membrane fusion protein [Silvimonas terrae]
MQRKRISSVAALLVLAPIAAAVLSACQDSRASEQAAAPPPPTVSVAAVVHKSLNDWDEFTGRLEAPQTVEIRPRVSGYVQTVNFREGAVVKKGDLLFQIDPRPFQAEVDRLAAENQSAKAHLAQAHSDAERAQRLKSQDAISQEDFDARNTALLAATAQVDATTAELASAKLNLEYTHVTAPINGRVSNALITAGNLVSSSAAGASLLTTVVSTDKVYAYFDADEQTFLKYQQQARQHKVNAADDKYPIFLGLADEAGYPHQGAVDFLDNQVNPRTGTIRARAVFDNQNGEFTPGLFVRLKLIGEGQRDGILINDRAVSSDLGKKFVLVVGADNKLVYRTVELGSDVDNLRLVKSGLKAGDVIVVNGLQKVRPGMAVTPAKVPMDTPSDLDRQFPAKG